MARSTILVKWPVLGPVACAILLVQIASASEKDFPEGAGKAELLKACGACHNTERIRMAKHTRAEWTSTISRMSNRGVDATDDEMDLILEYLVQNFPKDERVNVNKAETAGLIR